MNEILNEDLWSLGELIQLIWRGCIRKDKPMNVYIPSKRMRSLLINWLNGDFIESQAFAYLAIRSLLKKEISFVKTTNVKKSCTGGILVKNY